MMETESRKAFTATAPLSTPDIASFVDHVFKSKDETADKRIDLVDLSGLPPATVIAAQIDPLRSETEDHAPRRKAAGVAVNEKTFAGVTQMFFGMGRSFRQAGHGHGDGRSEEGFRQDREVTVPRPPFPGKADGAKSTMMVAAPDFARTVMSSNQFEIQSSGIAETKVEGADVKKFATAMIRDHEKARADLKAAFGKDDAAATSAPALAPKHAAMPKRREEADGADFQPPSIDMRAQADGEAVSLFRTYAGSRDDEAVVAFAGETLPTLDMHMTHAEEPVTAHRRRECRPSRNREPAAPAPFFSSCRKAGGRRGCDRRIAGHPFTRFGSPAGASREPSDRPRSGARERHRPPAIRRPSTRRRRRDRPCGPWRRRARLA